MLYTSIRRNQQENIDIPMWYEETISAVANLFDKQNKYYSEDNPYFERRKDGTITDYTDFDKLEKDFSQKEINKRVFEEIKKMAKQSSKDELLIKHKTYFIEVDGLWDVVNLIDDGLLKKSDLKQIKAKAKRKGFNMDEWWECQYDYKEYDYSKTITNKYGYEEHPVIRHYKGIDDLIEQVFPCKEELAIDEDGDEYYKCIQCGNCD